MRVRRLKKQNEARELTKRLVSIKEINPELDSAVLRMLKPKAAQKEFKGGTNLGRSNPQTIMKIRRWKKELELLRK